MGAHWGCVTGVSSGLTAGRVLGVRVGGILSGRLPGGRAVPYWTIGRINEMTCSEALCKL